MVKMLGRESDVRRLVCVTNIPTPYRFHLFSSLAEQLRDEGIELEVKFMAGTEPGRLWRVDMQSLKFNHEIAAGIHPSVGGSLFHFNLGLVFSLLRNPPTWLMVGGWHLPTAFCLVFMFSIFRRDTCTILWTEANYRSQQSTSRLVSRFRRFVGGRVSAYAVPGEVAEETIVRHWKMRGRTVLRLANVVDEHAFRDGVDALKLRKLELRAIAGIMAEDIVLLWPARLEDTTKGFINFLQSVAPVMPNHLKVLVAGEGADRQSIETLLKRFQLTNVRLLGHCSQERMLELLALADAMILPSLMDRNPLSVIESLWAGLPILISERCGNWPEAVRVGENGWVVDPDSVSSMQKALLELAGKSQEELARMGQVSRSIAEATFDTRKCVASFVSDLLTKTQARPPSLSCRATTADSH